jgi:transcriptional regulator of acetoin/glycerol metabolism
MDDRSHVSRVLSVLQDRSASKFATPGSWWRTDETSWRRCLERYRLDPARHNVPNVLSGRELSDESDQLDSTLRIAAEELDRLFTSVHAAGYAASFSSASGVIIVERANVESPFYPKTDCLGSVWSEEKSGTNGIGTCLVERRPVAVWLNDHFFPNYTKLSCVSVPIFGAEAEPTGALNVSTINPRIPETTHQLIFGITTAQAERMNERIFRHRFGRYHLLRLADEETGRHTALVAVDADHQIIGINHVANKRFEAEKLTKGQSLWSVFERNEALLAENVGSLPRNALRLRATGASISASARPPIERGATRAVVVRSASNQAPARLHSVPTLDDCAGADRHMLANVHLIRRVMKSQLPLLLLGETGVGKDTLARAIHLESIRARKPYVAFSCAAVPETLIDSELFGYGSGAFTGAKREGSTGRLLEANGGTLFLDEIGDMPSMLQTRLLRVLESGEVMPLGSGKVHRVDIQVIAATHQNLEQMVAKGTFRKDLYYRLAGVVVQVPPLRDREDLDLMIRRSLEHFACDRVISLNADALETLRSHHWGGNMRELRHVIQRAAELCDNDIIRPCDLLLRIPTVRAPRLSPARPPEQLDTTLTAREALAAAERALIDSVLQRCGGDINDSAQSLGISRATLYRKLRRYHLGAYSETCTAIPS